MTGPITLRNLLWMVTTSAEVILFLLLIRQKLLKTYPAFAVYVLSTIVQSAFAVFCYTRLGFDSRLTSHLIWGSQGVVIALRFVATIEMARRILSEYRGLWSLGKRLLATIGVFTVLYSLLVANKQFNLVVLNLDRGVELAIATVIVGLLLFARCYLLPIAPLDRALAIGFSLYSCFYVINDTIFEKLHNKFLEMWGYLDILTFLASLLIWNQAVWIYAEARSELKTPKSVTKDLYGRIAPEFNVRLKNLNEQVSQLLRAEKQSP